MSLKKLSFLDRYLSLWIVLAMIFGIILGSVWPNMSRELQTFQWKNTNLLLALGLIAMMYPPLARVKYEQLLTVLKDSKTIYLSLVVNWVIGPALMFLLAWLTLADLPHYRNGIVLIGIARCIAMVLVWNDLAGGSRELGAGLVAINSLFQLITFSVMAWFYLSILPGILGFATVNSKVDPKLVWESVLIFLGTPAFLGLLTWFIGRKKFGETSYYNTWMPRLAPLTMYALLFTIMVMFGLKADTMIELPFQIVRVSIPLVLYFGLMFFITFKMAQVKGIEYSKAVTISMTATGNNFELAIAVAIGVFGIQSGEAFAGVVGPLIEVPALLILVKAAKYLGPKWFSETFKRI